MSTSTANKNKIAGEINRRRTFAIISHPDAGKTTLTEKLLLYSGAIHRAGAVRSRKNQRHATSDWMEMEQTRGISITSASLQFEFDDKRLNLLDTPGHQDFSEDTYRTLLAVDSAIMVLDAAKGIEAQTLKLFKVCRRRGIPILTFINKLDRPARPPLELIDQINEQLNIKAVPMNWPIGDGPDFQGVYDLKNQQVLLFERTSHGEHRAPVEVGTIEDERLPKLLGERQYEELHEMVQLLLMAGPSFDEQAYLNGELTPVFFGSALHNFGVESFLQALVEMAPAPQPRQAGSRTVQPQDDAFSGFVFKIQANMDPRHRDQVAFLRVVSGKFEKDMSVYHPRLDRDVRLSRPHQLFGGERETTEVAYPGDVVGLSNRGLFHIGDTLSDGDVTGFEEFPRFQPEFFATLRNDDVMKSKQFRKGLDQLQAEGAIQLLYSPNRPRSEPILAAVGQLQFEVVQSRLKAEYGIETSVQSMPHECARWVSGDAAAIDAIDWNRPQILKAFDADEQLVALFHSDYWLSVFRQNNPKVTFATID